MKTDRNSNSSPDPSRQQNHAPDDLDKLVAKKSARIVELERQAAKDAAAPAPVTRTDASKSRNERHLFPKPIYKGIKIEHRTQEEKRQLKEISAKIEAKYHMSSVPARVLANRGFKPGKTLNNFLNPSVERDLLSKAPLKDLDKGAKAIVDAVKSGKKIAVCCDYDVDGGASAAQMVQLLKSIDAKYELFPTHRLKGGYGLKNEMVERADAKGCEVLITLDIGTKDHDPILLAKAKGMKTIVIDHHEVDRVRGNPVADVFINPHQKGCPFPDKILCTGGVNYCVIAKVKEKLERSQDRRLKTLGGRVDLDVALQLAALATVADVVPLTGANRAIVHEGLRLMNEVGSPGIDHLRKVAGVKGEITAGVVSHQLAPRGNAPGRLEEDPEQAGVMSTISLLVAQNRPQAEKLANRLQQLNEKRRHIEKETLISALQKIKRKGELPEALVVHVDKGHPGVLGIVASRLVELFNRPAIVLAGPNKDGIVTGSARSVQGVHLADLLESQRDKLVRFGGHDYAAGLSLKVDKLAEFEAGLNREVKSMLKGTDRTPYVVADAEISLQEIKDGGEKLCNELKLLEPSGRANSPVKFLVRDANVLVVTVLKDNHLSVLLQQGTTFVSAKLWHHTEHPAIKEGATISLVGKLDVDRRSAFNEKRNQVELHILAAQTGAHAIHAR